MTDKKSLNVEFAGVDDGHAYTKVVNKNGEFKIRSMVKPGVHIIANIFDNGKPSDDRGYETDGIKYTAGDLVDGEDTRFDGFIGSPLNRVIVHHGLHCAGMSGKEVKIATGLPVNRFYVGGKPNMDVINGKRKSMEVPVNSMGDEANINIVGNVVCSEGVAAWMDYYLDMEGNPVREMSEYPVGIVDIGGRTTDCVWVTPPSAIDHSRSGTQDVGVLDIINAVSDALKINLGIGEAPRWMIEKAITHGTFRKHGVDVNVKSLVDEAVHTVTEKIMREVDRKLGDGSALDVVIFVGGGIALIPEIAKRYPNAYIPENPEFSNARGMYKYMLYVNNNRTQAKS